jgi:hypothetical protein
MDSLCCCYSWLGDMVWAALCCYGCLEIWFALHCTAMDVWRYGLDCFVLPRMFGNLVCTALYCYGCCTVRFGWHCVAIDVEGSGLYCFVLLWM